MFSTLGNIVDGIVNSFSSFLGKIGGLDTVFFIALAVEVALVLFFLIKSALSYEASLNRALDKINIWLFERKNVTEENIKDLNALFKAKAPKRLCYYWQQYILFREGTPSSYLSTENLIENPLKTSSYNANIKNLTLFSLVWATIVAIFSLVAASYGQSAYLSPGAAVTAILIPVFVGVIATIFIVYLRARKNSILNSLYQNVALFGRFMDNACIDLPTYIDYQILFTPQEIEKGQPVLREFLDYKARKEKEEFNKAKEDEIEYETYDFSSTGVDGSIVLDRAMKESELYLKKKEKILVKVSQLESDLDSRKKQFDNVQKEYQTKLQTSKENVNRLRQLQDETVNRIESNYLRKQQTNEINNQENLEQEFEQNRTKYLLEKNEIDEEIQKLNTELAEHKSGVIDAMLGEYQTFFNKFCQSAEKVVAKVFNDKLGSLKQQVQDSKEVITDLEIKLKNASQVAQRVEDTVANVGDNKAEEQVSTTDGKYDANGNYVYNNGTYYDTDGNFHDLDGSVYSQDGKFLFKDEPIKVENSTAENKVQESSANDDFDDFTFEEINENDISKAQIENEEEEVKEKKIVDFDDFDDFDFMTDVSQKDDIYGVAGSIINDLDTEDEIDVVDNSSKEPEVDLNEEQIKNNKESFENIFKESKPVETVESSEEHETLEDSQDEIDDSELENVEDFVEEDQIEEEEVEEPIEEVKRKPGRPKKVVESVSEEPKKRGRGRPKKVVEEKIETEVKRKPGRPKKSETVKEPVEETKRKPGRPKKEDVKEPAKKGPGRPKKSEQTTVSATPKKKPGRPKKIVKNEDETIEEPKKRGRGRPKKTESSINEINQKLYEEQAKMDEMRKSLNEDLESAMNNINSTQVDDNQIRRNQLIQEIEDLQKEAKSIIGQENSEAKIADINEKLEKLMNQISSMN